MAKVSGSTGLISSLAAACLEARDAPPPSFGGAGAALFAAAGAPLPSAFFVASAFSSAFFFAFSFANGRKNGSLGAVAALAFASPALPFFARFVIAEKFPRQAVERKPNGLN